MMNLDKPKMDRIAEYLFNRYTQGEISWAELSDDDRMPWWKDAIVLWCLIGDVPVVDGDNEPTLI